MVGMNNQDPMGLPHPAARVAGHKPADHHWVLGGLLFLIVIAGIAGIVVAMMSGQPTIAIIVALITGAIVAGATC
jgi:uncharacterized membrane-anchored protein